MSASRNISISLIGDLYVGKSTLIEVLITKKFYELKFSGADKHNLELKGRKLEIVEVVQNLGADIDSVPIGNADVFILCYSVDMKSSYVNIEYWNDRINKLYPKCKKILVGTKIDTRPQNPNPSKYVLYNDGELLQKKISAIAYMECSAKLVKNIDIIFEKAIEVKSQTYLPKDKNKKCKVM